MTDQTPIPAATVVIFRDRVDAPPELLVVERSKGMVFAGGMLVFPGGRIDPGDHALAAGSADPDEQAARIAAIRETIEEAGLPIGLSPQPDAATLARLRTALHAGADFGAAIAAEGLTLATDALVSFARWCPNHKMMRIFDTRFYLASMPDDAPEPSVDETENSRLLWASAADVLALCDAGKASIIFPTRRNLERLAQFDSFAAAVADAARWPVDVITPWIAGEDDQQRLHIPDGLGYPVTSEVLSSAMRG